MVHITITQFIVNWNDRTLYLQSKYSGFKCSKRFWQLEIFWGQIRQIWQFKLSENLIGLCSKISCQIKSIVLSWPWIERCGKHNVTTICSHSIPAWAIKEQCQLPSFRRYILLLRGGWTSAKATASGSFHCLYSHIRQLLRIALIIKMTNRNWKTTFFRNFTQSWCRWKNIPNSNWQFMSGYWKSIQTKAERDFQR